MLTFRHAANLSLVQSRLQSLAWLYFCGVTNDLARRGVGGDGIAAFENVSRRKQVEAGLDLLDTVLRIFQTLTHSLPQPPLQFAQALLAALQYLRRAHAPQTLARVLPDGLAVAPAVFHSTQQPALQVIQRLQLLVESPARM